MSTLQERERQWKQIEQQIKIQLRDGTILVAKLHLDPEQTMPLRADFIRSDTGRNVFSLEYRGNQWEFTPAHGYDPIMISKCGLSDPVTAGTKAMVTATKNQQKLQNGN